MIDGSMLGLLQVREKNSYFNMRKMKMYTSPVLSYNNDRNYVRERKLIASDLTITNMSSTLLLFTLKN